MRKGAYSDKFKALEKDEIRKLKKDIRSVVDQRKEKERNIARETNKRRRYLALKRKTLEDVEERKRQQVLIARKEKHLESTKKFQRNQKFKVKENVKDEKSDAYPLQDGLYNIRGHVVVIKDGIRVTTTTLPLDGQSMKGNLMTNEQKTGKKLIKNHVSANQNALYSGKSYLLHHLDDLVNGQERSSQYQHGEEAVSRNEADQYIENKNPKYQRLEESMKQNCDVIATPVGNSFSSSPNDDSKMPPSDVSVSSTDSLEMISDSSTNQMPKTPKSSLKNRKNCFNIDKEKRKVKFNNSIEFNDGFVWLLKDNEQKPASSFENRNTILSIPVQDKPKSHMKPDDEKDQQSVSHVGKHGGASFVPALPRFDDYSYPDSVDLSAPSTTDFAKKSKYEPKIPEARPVDREATRDHGSVWDKTEESSPTDSLEMDNDEISPLDLNANECHQTALPDAISGITSHAAHAMQKKHVTHGNSEPHYNKALPGTSNGSSHNSLYNKSQESKTAEVANHYGSTQQHYNLTMQTDINSPAGSHEREPERVHQSHFQNEMLPQGEWSEDFYQKALQNSSSQESLLRGYDQAVSPFTSNVYHHSSHISTAVPPYHHPGHDRNSFLNIRGNSYFPNRPSLEQGYQHAVNNNTKTSHSTVNEYSKYESSSQSGSTAHHSLVNAPNMNHEAGSNSVSRTHDVNVADRSVLGSKKKATNEGIPEYRASAASKNAASSGNITKPVNVPFSASSTNVPYNAASAIDINQVIKMKNGTNNKASSESDEDDEIISNVRKSMAELKFSAKWEPSLNINEQKYTIDETKDPKQLERPANKAKIIESDVWVNDSGEIKKQSKIESFVERKSNIPIRTASTAEKSNVVERKISSGKAPQKADLVPHPPPGPKGRLFPRKRPSADVVTKRGSPMKVVDPNKIVPQGKTRGKHVPNVNGKIVNYADYDDNYHNYADGTNYEQETNGDWAERQKLANQQQNSDGSYIYSKIQSAPGDNNFDKNVKINTNGTSSFNKTPTDDDINELWYDVQSCLKTKPPHKASSDSVYISSPWRQQRTWSGSRNFDTRQAGHNQGFPRPQNQNAGLSGRLGSTLPLRRYGSHENLRRENSLDNLAGNVKIRGRSAMLPQRPKGKITPSVQAFSLRKSTTAPEPMQSNQAPAASKSRPDNMSESLASFLALEAMCQQESLSPHRTSAILKASHNAYKGMKGDQRQEGDSPVFFNESRRQEPSALSIEERKVMQSLDRLNSRLREKESESNKQDAATRWNSSLLTNGPSIGSSRGTSRSGNSPNVHNLNSRRNFSGNRQGKYKT